MVVEPKGYVACLLPLPGALSRAARLVVSGLVVLSAAGLARGAGTPAGSLISNTASATYSSTGIPGSADSNIDTFRVDEVLDVTLVPNDPARVGVVTPLANAVLSFTLTNTGNGPEDFRLTFDAAQPGNDFDPQAVRIYLDDGDATFNGADVLYAFDVNNPRLAADASRIVFVVGNVPGGLAAADVGDVELAATAQTGSGPPGTSFAGAGEGGVDAVAGASTARAAADSGLVVVQVSTSLVKSQAVRDPSGGAVPTAGAVVTYTLAFAATGTGTLQGVEIVDPIPSGTTFVPGSIRLDGSPLTDAAGDDDGEFDGVQVLARPGGGTVAVPANHTVLFQVTINAPP